LDGFERNLICEVYKYHETCKLCEGHGEAYSHVHTLSRGQNKGVQIAAKVV